MTTLNNNLTGISHIPNENERDANEASPAGQPENWGIPLSNEDYIEIARQNNAQFKAESDGNYFYFRSKEEAEEFLKTNSKIYIPPNTWENYSSSLIRHHPPQSQRVSRQERRALERERTKGKKLSTK